MKYVRLTFFITVFLLAGFFESNAKKSVVLSDSAYRFIELKKSFESLQKVDILGQLLCIRYKEERHKEGKLKARILDSNKELLLEFSLSSKYGDNKYVINLEELPYQWEEKTNYWFELIGGGGVQYTLLFQLLPAVLNTPPAIDIITDIKYSDCKNLSSSLIDFYGEVKSDNFPCRLEWKVTTPDGVPLLRSVIETIDSTQVSTITLMNIPPYIVNLKVEDACGNIQYASVSLNCSSFKKSKLHIYLEKGIKNKNWTNPTN